MGDGAHQNESSTIWKGLSLFSQHSHHQLHPNFSGNIFIRDIDCTKPSAPKWQCDKVPSDAERRIRWQEGKTSTVWEALSHRQRECVNCFERKTCTANKIHLKVNTSSPRWEQNKPHCPRAAEEGITFRGLEFFWLQRRQQKSKGRTVLWLHRRTAKTLQRYTTTSNVTTEHIEAKL